MPPDPLTVRPLEAADAEASRTLGFEAFGMPTSPPPEPATLDQPGRTLPRRVRRRPVGGSTGRPGVRLLVRRGSGADLRGRRRDRGHGGPRPGRPVTAVRRGAERGPGPRRSGLRPVPDGGADLPAFRLRAGQRLPDHLDRHRPAGRRGDADRSVDATRSAGRSAGRTGGLRHLGSGAERPADPAWASPFPATDAELLGDFDGITRGRGRRRPRGRLRVLGPRPALRRARHAGGVGPARRVRRRLPGAAADARQLLLGGAADQDRHLR